MARQAPTRRTRGPKVQRLKSLFQRIRIKGAKRGEKKFLEVSKARRIASLGLRPRGRLARKTQFGRDEAEELAKAFADGPKRQIVETTDLRSIPTKIDSQGRETQTPFAIGITFDSRRILASYTREEIAGAAYEYGRPAFLMLDDPVGSAAREQAQACVARTGKTPAYLQFYVFGFTPGNPQGDGRRPTTKVSYKYFRVDLDPTLSATLRENTSQFVERATRQGLVKISTDMLQDFTTSSGPYWTVLKVTVECGFERKPNNRQLRAILRRAQDANSLGVIAGGKAALRRLNRTAFRRKADNRPKRRGSSGKRR